MEEKYESPGSWPLPVTLACGIGAMLTAPAVYVAILSAGFGHGGYFLTRALFPIPMLATLITGDIRLPSILLALAQFPLYGAFLGRHAMRSTRAFWAAAAMITSVHFIAALACFSGLLSDFSG